MSTAKKKPACVCAIRQDGMAPHTMRCDCGVVWIPAKSRGGVWTDGGLERADRLHREGCACRGR